MQTFERFLLKKLGHEPFRRLYERECHVCEHTVRLFETALAHGISLQRLGEDLAVDADALIDLRDADHCDPQLVVRLCRHLELDPPTACPRMK